jgi:hypothetical protein
MPFIPGEGLYTGSFASMLDGETRVTHPLPPNGDYVVIRLNGQLVMVRTNKDGEPIDPNGQVIHDPNLAGNPVAPIVFRVRVDEGVVLLITPIPGTGEFRYTPLWYFWDWDLGIYEPFPAWKYRRGGQGGSPIIPTPPIIPWIS